MFRRRKKPFCVCGLAFALGALFAFVFPIWLVAVIEAVIIIIFAWMLFCP